MPRYTPLKGKLFERGVTQKQIGDLIGKGQSYLTMRINGHKPWKTTEIKLIADYLGIPQSEWPFYFF